MRKEKKTRSVKLETNEPETCPMIVRKVEKSMPKMRTVKSKQKMEVATSICKSTSAKEVTTREKSGNIMKLCVNLMPVLAAAKEPVEEEERTEEENSCTSKKEPETSCKNDPSAIKSVKQTLDYFTGLHLETDTKQPPRSVLPPITQLKPAPESYDCHKRCPTPLPPISLSEQTRIISSNLTIKGCRGDGLVSEQVADSRPWIDNPLFSKSRSPEFRLPEISLSSLDTLLQTVTQKLRRKRKSRDEGLWRHVQSDHLLVAVSEQRLREKNVTENRNLARIEAVTETSVGVNRQMRLPPLLSAPKPMLILTMTKKNLLTSNTLQ